MIEINRVKFLCPIVVLRSVNFEVDWMTDNANFSLMIKNSQVLFTVYERSQIYSEIVTSLLDI